MLQQAERSKTNAFELIPVSFFFDLENIDFEKELKEFINFYNLIKDSLAKKKKNA